MKKVSFRTGLHLNLNKVPYYIERILITGECYLERESDRALIVKTKDELKEELVKGNLSFNSNSFSAEDSTRVCENFNSLAEPERSVIHRRYAYVSKAKKLLGDLPTTVNLGLVIEKVSIELKDKAKPSTISVYRWWTYWKSSGYDINSLRNRKPGKTGTRKFNRTVIDEFDKVIDDIYLTPQCISITRVYKEFCTRMNKINDILLFELPFPSKATFHRMVKKLPPYDVMVARKGKKAANKHFRIAGAGPIVDNILERVEVDHTPLDIMIVNEETGEVDGRPWITMLIDYDSRLPLGFEIGFEPPSQLSVMRALRNAILPKTYIRERYSHIENDWLAFGIPMSIVCDNGLEFHSNLLKQMCMELDIELQYCPKHEPWYKGAVERFLGTLNRAVCHTLPGTTFSNITERGDYDSVKHAKVTLKEIVSLVHEWIIDIYSQSIHKTTLRTPSGLWSEGLNTVEPLLPESLDKLNFILTREATRVLSHKGIEINNLFYNSNDLWSLITRKQESYPVTVRYDAENVGYIWIYDERVGDYIKVPCTMPEYAEGLSLRNHNHIRKLLWDKGKSEQNEEKLLIAKDKFARRQEELSKNKSLRVRQKTAREQKLKISHEPHCSNGLAPSALDEVYDFEIVEGSEFKVDYMGGAPNE